MKMEVIVLAWVSVHEEITGRKLRSLSKEIGCSQNECIGLLIRLWLWGLKNADRDGKIIDADKQDVADVLTVGLERNIDTMDAVNAMIHSGWIDEMNDGLYLHDWPDWQGRWYAYEDSRKSAAERKRRSRKKAADEEHGTAEKAEETERTDEPRTEEKPSATGKYSRPFEQFWSVYPRRVGKGEAYAKYKARRSDGWSDEQLIEAAKRYGEECVKRHTEPQYIKHAKTFLSDKTPFTDYLTGGLNTESSGPQQVSNATDDDPFADWR